MYNITSGNTIPMKAILEHGEERFPVAVSTNISVRAYNEYRYIDAENVTVDQEEDGVLYFEIPPTLNTGIFGVEVKGNVNGVSWRTATDGVVKITGATQRNDGSEAVPEGDTYDIVMRVQLYKNQSSDRAIEEHNSDEASHPYILGELERIEGEIPALPEHIVTDENYVHTDNNYTTEEKTKLDNTYTIEQTDEAIEQAKEDVSWKVGFYGAVNGVVTIEPSSNVIYIPMSSLNVSQLDIALRSDNFNVGDSFVIFVTAGEDKEGIDFVQTLTPITEIHTPNIINRPYLFKEGMTYKVTYTLVRKSVKNYTWKEVWVGGTATVAYTGSYTDLSDKPNIPTVPTNVSAFNNDAGYITKTVNDLVNYYLKSDTYTKTEVQQLISAIQQFTYQVVSSLPTASADTMNIIYLVPSADPQTQNVKDEYITIDNGTEAQTRYTWEQIGSTEIDLSGYYTSQQTDAAITAALNAALADYTTTAALTLLLADKQDVINDLATIRNGAAAGATAYQKPQGGIPSTDMSQAVQTSLGKADSSLQPTQQTLTDAQKQQARNNIGAAGVDDVPTLPDNVSYFSNDNGDGIVPTDGIKGEDIVASSAISVNPDVVTAITGEIGSATIITLVVPNDNLRHVWDMFFTTASDGGATIVVPQGATLHVPFGYSIASGKTYEVRIIGVGNDYYLTCQEYN